MYYFISFTFKFLYVSFIIYRKQLTTELIWDVLLLDIYTLLRHSAHL